MIKVYQTKYGRHGTNGDCFPACLASILQRRLSLVPDFFADIPQGMPVPQADVLAMNEWFAANGLIYFEVAVPGPLEQLLAHLAARCFNHYYILIGSGRSGETHSVVCLGDKIVHNPASISVKNALEGPCQDGAYRFGLVARRV
jgi:hypothetical protein